jgi:hypothetical protein
VGLTLRTVRDPKPPGINEDQLELVSRSVPFQLGQGFERRSDAKINFVDKTGYDTYYESALRLVRLGGLIVRQCRRAAR